MSSAGQAPNSKQTHDQWLRKVNLIVANESGEGLDLSQFRTKFRVSQSDLETPNNAEITIYNLSAETVAKIKKEYTEVTLQAGYQNGAVGIIFKGTIKQSKAGREDQANTYLKIFAADGDTFYNFGMVNMSMAAGTPPADQIKAVAKSMGTDTGQLQFNTGLQSNIRGKVLYGMGRTQLRNMARTGLSSFSIQNGKVTFSSLTGYSDGTAVVLNSQTGMVGLPEQTEEGIKIRCLLNPRIIVGTQVQIDQGSVQRASVSFGFTDPNQFENAFPPVTNDGFYYVLVCEHEGDTRGNEYYSTLTCLSVNKTVPKDQSVKPAG